MVKNIKLIPIFLALFPNEARSEIFVCDIKQVQQLTEKGTLGRTQTTDMYIKYYGRVIWNTISGDLRVINKDGSESGFKREVKMIQKGTNENSAFGLRVFTGPARVVVTTMSVSTWINTMPFLLTEDEIITGNCSRIN